MDEQGTSISQEIVIQLVALLQFAERGEEQSTEKVPNVETETSATSLVEKYYETYSQNNRHNNCCQISLRLEKKLKVKYESPGTSSILLFLIFEFIDSSKSIHLVQGSA